MNYLIIVISVLWGYMNIWFIISVLKKRNDMADVAWGLGFVLLAWISFLIPRQISFRGLLVSLLVSVWGLRLAWHIYNRNRDKQEDYRYAEWRRTWGKWFYPRSYFQIYILQGIFLFIIVLPVLLVNRTSDGRLGIFDIIGVLIWLIGFFFESVADAQLARFIKNPANRGKLMQSGLWHYTRHPNYFGEVTLWWGIWIIALNVTNGWLTIIGPFTITMLILFVSGIPLLEKKYAGRDDFEEYKKKTSIFFPLPPKI
jgi:steroid 5-alpha reductase family enzyme